MTITVEGLIALIGALSAAIVAIVNSFKQNSRIKALENELKSGSTYFVICPNCGSKILLKSVKIEQEDTE